MKYDGGKNGSGVYQRLICMMPPHRVYVEAFAGSAAILRRKRPAEKSIAYELDKRTIYELARHLPPEHFKPWNVNAEWTDYREPLPACGRTSIGFDVPGYSTGSLEIFCSDAFDALQSKFVSGSVFYASYSPADVLIYCDPPYPKSVRSSPGKIYQFEMMEQQEHGELCDLLLSMPCKVMLSGYDNDLYNSKLKGWRKEQIATTNRAGTRVIETVWLNFPEPYQLHDASHVGTNFRTRWNITKRVRNWTAQLNAMDAGTRQAIVEALAVENDKFLSAGQEREAKEMSKLAARAAKANKKRRPITPRPTLPPAEPAEIPIFE